jgi:hypothetical protein
MPDGVPRIEPGTVVDDDQADEARRGLSLDDMVPGVRRVAIASC